MSPEISGSSPGHDTIPSQQTSDGSLHGSCRSPNQSLYTRYLNLAQAQDVSKVIQVGPVQL